MEKPTLPGAPELPGSDSPKPQLLKELKPLPPPVPEVSDELDEPDELNEHVEDPGDPDGVVAAEAARRQWNDEHPSPLPPKKPKQKKRWPWLLVLLLLVLGAAAYYWFGPRKVAAPSPRSSVQSTQSAAAAPKSAQTQFKHYESTVNTLSIDYPQDWVVSDTAESLSLTSGVTSFTDSTGAKVKGKMTFTIQNQQSSIPGYPSAGAIAALASDKLTYKKPSASQRAQTYLSYLGFRSASELDRLFITGDNGYQPEQQVPVTDITGMTTLVSVVFTQCSTDACTEAGTPLSLQASSWLSSAPAATLKSVIQSIIFT